MNRFLVFLLSVSFTGVALGQSREFKIESISPSVSDTPKYNFSLAKDKRTPRAMKWLEVEVEFAAQPEFTDELTFKYYILFAGQLLVGEVTHVNIPAGRSLYSVMYVAPRTINRLLAGKTFSAGAIENVAVQMLRKGQLLAQESWKPAGSPNWFQSMPQVSGMVINKNETPFAPLYWDRYEAIKPAR